MRSWLVVWGIFATISLLFPASIILGLFLAMVPGIVLFIAPSVFVYLLLVSILEPVLKKADYKRPRLMAFVFCLLIGSTAAALLNIPIWKKYIDVKNSQISLVDKVSLPKTFAIFQGGSFYRFDAYGHEEVDPLCNELCQKLLYNGAVQKVIVGRGYPPTERNYDLVSYSIERKDHCKKLGYVANEMDDFALKEVSARMAMGECLVKTSSSLSEADVIFYHSVERDKERIELLRWNGSDYAILLRHNIYEANPYIIPLSGGWIITAGSSWSSRLGFFQYEQKLNHEVRYYGLDDYKEELDQIFGVSIKSPTLNKSVDAILLDRLFDSEATSSELEELFDQYVTGFVVGGVDTRVKQSDVVLLIRCIEDKRISHYFRFMGNLIEKASIDQKKKISKAAIDRVLVEPLSSSSETIQDIVIALSWSATEIGPTESQLSRLGQDPKRAEYIKKVLQQEIQDGWSDDGHIEKFLGLWKI